LKTILTPKTRYNLKRVIPFGLIWLFLGSAFMFVEYAATKDSGCNPESAIEINVSIILFALPAVAALGLLVGVMEVFFVGKLFKNKNFIEKLIFKILLYGLIFFLVILITFPIAASLESNKNIFSSIVWNKFFLFTGSITFLSTSLQMGFNLVVSIFYSEIADKLGQGAFYNFLSGQYHKPKQETRIFMFADMKSSTSIAEGLGHESYFRLLREYYQDLSKAILNTEGEVYQYVGDEIVVSWKVQKGLKDSNCLHCFIEMKKILQSRKSEYLSKFKVLPDFKAGFHMGSVTTGEIGALKKDIIFTGDVLNTAARILALCNKLKVDIIISRDLMEKLPVSDAFEIRSLGENQLRGKREKLELFTIDL
jgi:adenylate cyclase